MGLNLPWWNAICLEGHAIPLNQPEWNQTANHVALWQSMAAYGQQMNGSKLRVAVWDGNILSSLSPPTGVTGAPGFSGHHLHSCGSRGNVKLQ